MKASIIICWTNEDIKNKAIQCLEQQDCRKDFEIIALDNREGKFTSAAKALNYGASIAKGEILIFMHQDILCGNSTDISELIGYFNSLQGLVLLGVAGYYKPENVVCSNITETEEHIVRYAKVIDEPIEVETLDECMLAMRKADFDNIKFDEKVCDSWHFYAVDLSYQVSLKGGKVWCVPVPVCHLSKGNVNSDFYKSLKKLCNKYKKVLPEINSTCVQTKNNILQINKLIVRRRLGSFLRKRGLRK